MLFFFRSSPSYFNACCQASFSTPDGLLNIKREPQHRIDIRLANPPAKTHFKFEHIRGMPILGLHRISGKSYNIR